MRQIAYPAAVSCGWMFGNSPSVVQAAEWSATPLYSSSFDYASNRRLVADAHSSEAGVLTADLRLKWALETVDMVLEPRYSFRRFSNSSLGDGDDRSLSAAFDWLRERSTLNLTASIWDQSTLFTEVLESGILSGNTHRVLVQAGGSWVWTSTERRQLIAQLTYLDASYHGQASNLLPGYRYPFGSFGERFFHSERGSITVSAYGSALSSETAGNSSHEYGIRAEVIHSFTERTHVDASLGKSARRLAGESSHGTDAAFTLAHDLTFGSVSFKYTRSLVPYGTGFLAERQQFTASLARPLTPFLDGNLSITRVENNQLAVLLNLDRRRYDSITTGLTWHPAETWTVSGQLAVLRTQAPGLSDESVHDVHSVVTLTWSPLPHSRSR